MLDWIYEAAPANRPRTSAWPRIYSGTASLWARRTLAEKVITSLPTCPIPEVARLRRTLRAWRAQAA